MLPTPRAGAKLVRHGRQSGCVRERVSAAQADADQSRLAAQQAQLGTQQAEADKAAMRARLSEQLNSFCRLGTARAD